MSSMISIKFSLFFNVATPDRDVFNKQKNRSTGFLLPEFSAVNVTLG